MLPEQLVPIGGLPVALLDDVRVALEKGDDLLTGWNLPAFDASSLRLIDHPRQDANGVRSFSATLRTSSIRAKTGLLKASSIPRAFTP